MPMVHGPSGSTSPMASTSASIHHDQMTAHYHQYSAYDAAREAAALTPAIASTSRNIIAAQQPQNRQLNINGRAWPEGQQQQQSSAAPSASSHYTNSDRSPSNLAVPSTSTHSARSASTTPSSSLAHPPANSLMPTTAASLMREGPRDFTVIKDVGDGSFGTVCLADWKSPLPSGTLLSPMQHPTTRPEYLGKRLVAIKKMKKPFPNWEECIKLKELKCLLAIPHHPNIIPLYDAFLMPTTKELHFVFECMEGNLYQLTKSRRGRPLAGGLVASIFQQIVKGLHHIHQEGYFHRDMKPENLLITTTGLADYPSFSPVPSASAAIEKDVLVIVKLADFGLARETKSQPPYTEYVSTRWYRAPEVLLRSRDYSNPVDMWALGTILAELVNLKPLFPGQSEVDQVMQICEILGDPSSEYGRDEQGRQRGGGAWNRGVKMAANVGFSFPKAEPVAFASLFGSKVPISLIECIQDLLRYEPSARLTTQDCINHVYYQKVAPRLQPPQARAVVAATTSEEQAALSKNNAKATAMSSFGSVMDQRAQRSALPPSHSMMSPASKPAFGESAAHTDHDTDVPMDTAAAATHGSHAMRLAPSPGPAGASGTTHYPALANSHSHSVYTGNHASATHFDNHQGPSQMEASRSEAQYYAAAQRRGQDEDVEMRQRQDEYAQRGNQQQQAGLANMNYGHANPVYRQTRPENHSFLAEPGYNREVDNANQPAEILSAKETEKRKSKGWISSVLGGQSSSNSQPNLSRRPSDQGQQSALATSTSAQSTNQMKVEPVPATAASPADAKKAKKLAEKAAREAEKAKRAAQELAARERARAVMQKRNQMLGDQTSRDQVEWLSHGDHTQSPGALNSSISLLPSEVARGKQPGIVQASPSDQFGALNSMSGYPGQSNGVGNTAWQTQRSSPRGKVRRREPDEHPSFLHRSHFAGDHLPRGDQRRMSIQSYQTGDSDPGPNRSLVPGAGMHLMQHHESTSSLNSAPGLIDGTSSSRTRFGDRNSFDTRSIASSLDNQLIQNMENISTGEWHRGGSTSPGPVHYVGQRPSFSRQSIGSRASSAHRQGSASPLHHQAPPRFHPYSPGVNGNAGQQPTSAHSSNAINLMSLASLTSSSGNAADFVESLHGGGVVPLGARPKSLPRRSSHNAHRGVASRGSSMASGDGPFIRQSSLTGPINPMFHVPGSQSRALSPPSQQQHQYTTLPPLQSNDAGMPSPTSQQPKLPPFSQLAAAASSSRLGGDDFYTSGEISPRHRSHSTSQQQQ